MILIRTAEALARAIDTPPDNELKQLLAARAESLADYGEYDFSDLAEFLIAQSRDRLPDVEHAYGQPLVREGCFVFAVETITRHGGWYEAVCIQSDDGFGLMLFVQDDPRTDAALLAACVAALNAANGELTSRSNTTA
jgi:hypothetical protein